MFTDTEVRYVHYCMTLYQPPRMKGITELKVGQIVQLYYIIELRLAYKLEPVFTQLLSKKQCPKQSEPDTPVQHLLHSLNIHHTKYENEFVKHKVPKLVSHVLLLDIL